MQPHLAESRSDGNRFMGNSPDSSGKFTCFHRKTNWGIHCPNTLVLQSAHDCCGDLIRLVASTVEFKISK